MRLLSILTMEIIIFNADFNIPLFLVFLLCFFLLSINKVNWQKASLEKLGKHLTHQIEVFVQKSLFYFIWKSLSKNSLYNDRMCMKPTLWINTLEKQQYIHREKKIVKCTASSQVCFFLVVKISGTDDMRHFKTIYVFECHIVIEHTKNSLYRVRRNPVRGDLLC